MGEETEINDITNGTETGAITLDTKLLSSVIIELNISRKNITLYPVEHPIINKAVTRAYNILQDLFKYRDEIAIGISKDTLIVDQSYLDKGNTVYRDFARAMNGKNIASVSFKEDLAISDLNGFLTVTSMSNEDLRARGGLQKELSEHGISGVSIKEIDYGSFELTSEDEISQSEGKLKEGASESIWDSFVYNLMGDSLGDSQTKVDKKHMNEMIKVDSSKLAAMMNQPRKKDEVTDYQYDRLISDYLKEAGSKEVSESERKKLIKEVASFTNELTPDLRKQLLASTFKNESKDLKGMEDFISDLSNETILDTLEGISAKRQKIPLTIMSLLQKFSQTGKDTKQFGAASKQIGREDVFDLKGEVEELLIDDHQKDYTPEQYQTALTSFVKKGNVIKYKEQHPELFNEFEESLTDEDIDLRHAIALIEIAKVEEKPDSFKMLSDRLSESGIFFTETGQYKSAAVVWAFFFSIINSQEYSKEDKEIVLEKIDYFKEQRIVDELIEGLRQWGKGKFEHIKEILLMFQDMSLKPLLKSLSFEENANNRKLLMNILSEMDNSIASELVKYLEHKRWYFVRNIIVLLRQLKAYDYIEKIRACYGHENKVVRVEVLKTLLELKGNVGTNILKGCIEDEDDSFSNSCILLIGSYHINELTPALIEKLSESSYSASDMVKKKVIIQSLGEMAEKSVIPHFEKILKRKSLLRKAKEKELKIKILESLRKFEHNDIKGLINIGLSSSDEDIQAVCKKY